MVQLRRLQEEEEKKRRNLGPHGAPWGFTSHFFSSSCSRRNCTILHYTVPYSGAEHRPEGLAELGCSGHFAQDGCGSRFARGCRSWGRRSRTACTACLHNHWPSTCCSPTTRGVAAASEVAGGFMLKRASSDIGYKLRLTIVLRSSRYA